MSSIAKSNLISVVSGFKINHEYISKLRRAPSRALKPINVGWLERGCWCVFSLPFGGSSGPSASCIVDACSLLFRFSFLVCRSLSSEGGSLFFKFFHVYIRVVDRSHRWGEFSAEPLGMFSSLLQCRACDECWGLYSQTS